MEQETLFTSSKWDILKCLESGKKSPIELAKESNTTVANISQQLRLLELAGFVKSGRIPNREKGMPRIVYSLADNYSYLISSCPGFVGKKFMKLEDYQKITLKIWFIEDKSLQYYIEKFYWSIEHIVNEISYLALDINDTKEIKVYCISSADPKKFKDYSIDGKYGIKNFKISIAKNLIKKKIQKIVFLLFIIL